MSAENKPAIQPAPVSEPVILPDAPLSFTDGMYTVSLAKRKDGAGLSVRIQHGGTQLHTVGVFPDPEKGVDHVRIGYDIEVFSAESFAAEETEPEPTIQLWGNIGTEIQHATSPQGVPMASFQFGEHPVLFKDSHYNQQPEEEKPHMSENNTVWRTVVAFGDRVALLEGATKKIAYILTCVPRTWTETSNNGKEKTVNGFHLLNLEPVRKKPRTNPNQKPLL